MLFWVLLRSVLVRTCRLDVRAPSSSFEWSKGVLKNYLDSPNRNTKPGSCETPTGWPLPARSSPAVEVEKLGRAWPHSMDHDARKRSLLVHLILLNAFLVAIAIVVFLVTVVIATAIPLLVRV